MNIVVYGATGNAGSKITSELLSRNHKVKAVARDITKVLPFHGLLTREDDLSDVDSIATIVLGADVVVSAYNPPPDDANALVDVTRRLISAVSRTAVPRLLMVGGCGLLEVAPGVTLIDSGKMPPEYMPLALAHQSSLAVLKGCDIDWTFLSCALYFVPGERTGKYRLGTSELIANEAGDSRISFADYAVAMADEIESPRHERASFSVGY